MVLRSLLAVVALVLGTSVLATAPASAVTFDFSYSDVGNTVFGSGQLFGDLVGPNQYDLTGITGTANGFAITGLSSFAGADNQLFVPPAPNQISFAGISFATLLGGITWNLFHMNADGAYFALNDATCLSGNPGDQACTFTPISFVASVVPLPPAVLLFGTALAGLGFLARGRKRKAPLAA